MDDELRNGLGKRAVNLISMLAMLVIMNTTLRFVPLWVGCTSIFPKKISDVIADMENS
jgi:hypothetical protein